MGFCYMVETYQAAKKSKGDLAVFTAMGGGEREAQGASWEKTITQKLPDLFLDAFPLSNSPG